MMTWKAVNVDDMAPELLVFVLQVANWVTFESQVLLKLEIVDSRTNGGVLNKGDRAFHSLEFYKGKAVK